MKLYNRDTPYAPEHRGSLSRKAQPPRNLLAWFLEAFRAELPGRIHAADVWRDRVSQDEAENGIQAVGGSLLGSPRVNDTFRRYIEESPFCTQIGEYDHHKDTDGHYSYPVRAALARLAGRGPLTDPYPAMALFLHRTFQRDGDWHGAGASLGLPEAFRGFLIEDALRRLYIKWAEEPPARTMRKNVA